LELNKINVELKVDSDVNLSMNIHEVGSPLWLIVVHGLGEHKGRHDYLFKLVGEDVNILTFDIRGHGLSDGAKADISSFDLYISDLDKVVSYLEKNYNLKDYILLGHSMGGLISTRFVQTNFSHKPVALFLSSPALGITGMAKKTFNFLPDNVVEKLASLKKGIYLKGVLDLKKLSHHYLVYTNYINDPLCSLKTNTRLLFKIVNESGLAFENYQSITIPTYGAIGSADVLVDVDSGIDFFDKIEMRENLLVIEGAFHELHNEIPDYKDLYIPYLKKTILKYRYNEIN
jgi:alpha-beta hydrolase superfamily lysophospholipase